MSKNGYIQKQAASSRERSARLIKAVDRSAENETPTKKQHRLMRAMFREFVKECPGDAAALVKELAPDHLSG